MPVTPANVVGVPATTVIAPFLIEVPVAPPVPVTMMSATLSWMVNVSASSVPVRVSTPPAMTPVTSEAGTSRPSSDSRVRRAARGAGGRCAMESAFAKKSGRGNRAAAPRRAAAVIL